MALTVESNVGYLGGFDGSWGDFEGFEVDAHSLVCRGYDYILHNKISYFLRNKQDFLPLAFFCSF